MCLRLLEQTAVISKYIQSDRRRVKSKRLEIDPFGGEGITCQMVPRLCSHLILVVVVVVVVIEV